MATNRIKIRRDKQMIICLSAEERAKLERLALVRQASFSQVLRDLLRSAEAA